MVRMVANMPTDAGKGWDESFDRKHRNLPCPRLPGPGMETTYTYDITLYSGLFRHANCALGYKRWEADSTGQLSDLRRANNHEKR